MVFFEAYSKNKPPLELTFDSTHLLISLNNVDKINEINDFVLMHFNKTQLEYYRPMFKGHRNSKIQKLYEIKFVKGLNYGLIFEKFKKIDFIAYVEFAPIYKLFATPNDFDSRQWYLNKINANMAWDIQKGSSNVKIAIIDDAVDINHEDLKQSIYTNALEIPMNGIDDDGNGYIDDYKGWHATYDLPNPNPPFINRHNFSHGTHCAGIAAATTDNLKGIASIGYNVQIVPIACSDSLNPGYIVSGYQGIVYAADLGVDVISLSWGGSGFSNTGQTIIDYAISKNIVICAAAGNNDVSLKMYPAAYNGVISVAATDENDKKARFSNYGNWIDISAPGVNIFSTITGQSIEYDYLSGTSMACPLTAGLCALMRSRNSKLTPADIENCLKQGADKIDYLNSNYKNLLGAGRINAFKSMQCLKPMFADFKVDKSSICPSSNIQFIDLSVGQVTQKKWTIWGPQNFQSSLDNPVLTFNVEGSYHAKLWISDGVYKDSIEYLNIFKVEKAEGILRNMSQNIKLNDVAFLTVDLKGEAPWQIKVSDGVNTNVYSNIIQNPYYFDVKPIENSIYQLIEVSDSRCLGQFSGSVSVSVDTSQSNSQPSSCSKFELFSKVYDFGGNEVPHTVYTLNDGNIAIVGITNKGGIGGDDIFLSKLKPNGDLIWTKYYGTTANENGYPLGIFDDNDLNIYIYGSSFVSSPESSLLIKLDQHGQILYTQTSLSNLAQDIYRGGIQLSNGNIAIASTSGITNNQAAGAFVVNDLGARVWEKSFDKVGSTEHFINVVQINNNIYFTGHTSNGNGGFGSLLTKMTLNGNVVWQKYPDFSYWDAIIESHPTHLNTIVNLHWVSNSGASKFGKNDIGITHYDTNGNIIWNRIIGGLEIEDPGGLMFLNDCIYITGTTKSFDNGNSKIFLIKLDINGNLIWSKIYGEINEIYNKALMTKMITKSNDGGIVIVYSKQNNTKDLILIKVDECGKSNCKNRIIAFNMSSEIVSSSNSNLTNLGLLNIQSQNIITKTSVSSISDNICPVHKPKCFLKSDFIFSQTCIKDSVYFNQKTIDLSGKSIENFKWIFHDGSFIVGSPYAKYKYSNTGTFKVTLISYSDTPNQCSDTIVRFLQVVNKLSGKIVLNKLSHCKGDTISLLFSSVCGVAPIKIQWEPKQFIIGYNDFQPIVSLQNSSFVIATITDAENNIFKDSIYIEVDNTCCKYESKLYTYKSQYCMNDTIDVLNLKLPLSSNSSWLVYREGVLVDSMQRHELRGFKLNGIGLWQFYLYQKGDCKLNVSSIEVFVYPLPLVNAGKDTLLCHSSRFNIGDLPISAHAYKWTPETGLSAPYVSNPIVDFSSNQTYILNVKDLQTQCSASDTINLLLGSGYSMAIDTVLCEGKTLQFTPINSSFYTFKWENGSRSPVRVFQTQGIYILEKTNVCGVYYDTLNIDYELCFCELTLPNAFSPDGNAINEFFPQSNIETIIDMKIYNRWGELLYENQSTQKGWDGKLKGEKVQEGVYMYLIKYRNCNGKIKYLRGAFTLLR